MIKEKPIVEQYKIADIDVTMKTYYQRTYNQAKKYHVKNPSWKPEDTDVRLSFGHEYYEMKKNTTLKGSTFEDIEYICTGSLFNRFLLKYNGCMLHSSAVVVDGHAYLFSANSGTGKSTHTNLWIKHFGEKAFILNDDKPALRKVNGCWYAYGTPWSGKTDLNSNKKVKLGAIVFLERSDNNWIEPISVKEAIPRFFRQTVRKLDFEETMDAVLENMEKVITEVPIYKMGCNISDDAVVTAYEKIRRV